MEAALRSRHSNQAWRPLVRRPDRGGTYDRELQYRIERHWELHELTGIPLAMSVGDENGLSECINKLRAGPVFG